MCVRMVPEGHDDVHDKLSLDDVCDVCYEVRPRLVDELEWSRHETETQANWDPHGLPELLRIIFQAINGR